jgi:hypothetical protein
MRIGSIKTSFKWLRLKKMNQARFGEIQHLEDRKRKSRTRTYPFILCIREYSPRTTDNFNYDTLSSTARRGRRDEVMDRVWGKRGATLPDSGTVFATLWVIEVSMMMNRSEAKTYRMPTRTGRGSAVVLHITVLLFRQVEGEVL